MTGGFRRREGPLRGDPRPPRPLRRLRGLWGLRMGGGFRREEARSAAGAQRRVDLECGEQPILLVGPVNTCVGRIHRPLNTVLADDLACTSVGHAISKAVRSCTFLTRRSRMQR